MSKGQDLCVVASFNSPRPLLIEVTLHVSKECTVGSLVEVCTDAAFYGVSQ